MRTVRAGQTPIQGCAPKVKFASITAVRGDGFIEFDFIYGDPDLSVELVLPFDAFVSFCAENGCQVSCGDADTRRALRTLDPIDALRIQTTIALLHQELPE